VVQATAANGLIAGILLLALASCGSAGGSADVATSGVAMSAGKLDPAYENGIKSVGVGPADPLEMVVETNGKVSVGGIALVQLDASGKRIDPTVYPGSSGESSPTRDAADNVYTLGHLSSGGYEIIKRNKESQLVAEFGMGGRLAIDARDFTRLTRLFYDAAGGFHLLGELRPANIAGPVTYLVAKLDPDGQRVMSYGSGGVAQLPAIYRDPLPAIAVDGEGNVFYAAIETPGRSVVRKLDRNGQPAQDFGDGGMAAVLCATMSQPLVAADSGGNVYVSGTCFDATASQYRAAVWKFDAHGGSVASFGSAGRAMGFFEPKSEAGAELAGAIYALLPNADGSVYVAVSAASYLSCSGGLTVVDLAADGTPAASFGTNGTVALALRGARPVALGADSVGRVYVLGETPPVSGCPLPRDLPYSISIFRLA
jgi:hypothetical protein